jgi:tetratricopeptide (TPR) repeat protein
MPASNKTLREQHLLSVILLAVDDRGAPPEEQNKLVSLFGARIDKTKEGALLFTLPSSEVATDQAANAARFALSLQKIFSRRAIAIATGRGETTPTPTGEVIERVEALLHLEIDLNEVRIDEVTANLLGARFIVSDVDGVLLLSAERDPISEARTLLGKESRLVGREQELSTLSYLFDECIKNSTTRVALVLAPAGAGKSRLCVELLKRHRTARYSLFFGRADSLRTGSPFSLLGGALKHALGLQDQEPLNIRQQKLKSRVAKRLPATAVNRVSAFLGELLGAPFSDENNLPLRAARQDPALMGEHVQRAVKDFLEAECQAQPILLLLEDLHWGDFPSISLVNHLLSAFQGLPFFVLASARPEVLDDFPKLWGGHDPHLIQLEPLQTQAAEDLIRSALGENVRGELISKLIERSGGNAFFLEELIRNIVLGGSELPETISAMVQARIEFLPPNARRALRAASIYGQSFQQRGVNALLPDITPQALIAALSQLEAAEIIYRSLENDTYSEDVEYRFQHAILQESAYLMILSDDLASGHLLAAEWLESKGEQDPILIAGHFERSGRQERAVPWYLSGAEQALQGNDFGAAIYRAERGILCGAKGERRGLLRLVQAEAHRWQGNHAKTERSASEAMSLLPPGGEPWHKAAGQVALAAGRAGRVEVLLPLFDTLSRTPPKSQALSARLMTLFRMGLQLRNAGHYELLKQLLSEIRALSHNDPPEDPLHLTEFLLALGLKELYLGDPSASLSLLDEATERLFEQGDAKNACTQRLDLGHAFVSLGAYAQAKPVLQSCIDESLPLGLPRVNAISKYLMGRVLFEEGDTIEAERLERAAALALARQGAGLNEGLSRLFLSRILLHRGDLEGAQEEVLAAERAFPEGTENHTYARLGLIPLWLARGDLPEALQLAEALPPPRGAIWTLDSHYVANITALSEALAQSGEPARARALIEQATEIVRRGLSNIANEPHRTTFLHGTSYHQKFLTTATRLGVVL